MGLQPTLSDKVMFIWAMSLESIVTVYAIYAFIYVMLYSKFKWV
jgi:hypothetical protein